MEPLTMADRRNKLYTSAEQKAQWDTRKALPKTSGGSRQSRRLRELVNRTRRAPKRFR